MTEDIRRKRAYYRACHRGTKEMDLMLGRYADAALAGMTGDILSAFEALLALPDPMLDGLLKGAQTPPPALTALVADIRAFHGLAPAGA
jgi:antitoxin CptB